MLDDKRTLLLDMDGTLLDLEFDNRFWREQVPAALARHRGRPLPEVTADVAATIRASEGTLAWYCLDHWSEQLDFDLVRLKEQLAGRIRFLDGAKAFLGRARAAGYRLIMVTNAHPETLRIKDEQTGVTAMMDRVVCSHDLGIAKEHVTFWPKLLGSIDGPVAELLLVDDSPAVLKTASRFVTVAAISRPDSSQPARDMRPFVSIERVADLLLR